MRRDLSRQLGSEAPTTDAFKMAAAAPHGVVAEAEEHIADMDPAVLDRPVPVSPSMSTSTSALHSPASTAVEDPRQAATIPLGDKSASPGSMGGFTLKCPPSP